MTTLGQLNQTAQKERERRLFEYQIEGFLKQWAPADLYERSAFESQLHSLVRQIYVDAQQPILDQLTKVIMAVPFPQLILKGKEE